ncbi:hypothetical protein ACFP1L_11870 [Lactiplantibacillus nangangensis]|uniref:Uncharacterized protein n=1 Tax=Lactiplantibacillus nangangensis TaxID=2559917 RepID=A0ABW1SLT3_9LACO|nr:hypothetical protein [Lactiplantibacillus nangangensis]
MKVLYFYDEGTGIFDHSELVTVDDEFTLPENATFVAPVNGSYEPIHINDDKTAWIGTPKEEWMAAHPAPAPTPTPEQTAQATLMLQMAQTKTTQDKFNAQIMLQLASMKSDTTTVGSTSTGTATTPAE